MAAEAGFARDVAERQVAMFTLFVGPGRLLTREALARASGIPASSLAEYAKGAAMPAHVLLALSGFLPIEALNMVTEVGGVHLVKVETSRASWDSLAATAARLTADICEASADGRIDHVERERLKSHARRVIADLQSVVEE